MEGRSQERNPNPQAPVVKLSKEEQEAFVTCLKSASLTQQIFPITAGGTMMYAVARLMKAKTPLTLTGLGCFLGLFVGRTQVSLQCQRDVAKQFPDGTIARTLAAAQRQVQGKSAPTEFIGGGGGGRGEPAMTSQRQQVPVRMNDDYQGGFADTHTNVQHSGLADENRRTVDNDELLPLGKSATDAPPARRTYEQIRSEHRAQHENRDAERPQATPAFGGLFTPQDSSQEMKPKPSLSSLENMEPKRAPAKPVRRNQYGDIIEE